jgi:bacillithiol biosynthesis cysteine-adding enzyme BshC
MTSAFGRLLTALLGDQGLVLVDPADPKLKAAARPLFLHEIETAPTSSRLVQTAWEKLKGLGYRPQIRLRGEGPNLFLLEEGHRSLKKGPHLKNLPEEAVERLSPNVVLRPLMQDFLFPTVSYVGGPNEIAYYAQLRGVYDQFGLPMPVILPRASLTIVEGRIERLLNKHHLSFLELEGDPEGVVNQVLRRSLPKSFLAKREKVLERIQEGFRELKEMVSTLDPTVAPRVGTAEGMVKKQVAELERLLLRSFKRRNQEVRTQILRILTHLLPDGELQERVYGFMPYVIRHGSPFLDLIKAGIDGPGWEHRVIYLGASKGDS